MYKNIKNACNSYILFKLNYKYHFNISYKKDINFYFLFKLIDKLLVKL